MINVFQDFMHSFFKNLSLTSFIDLVSENLSTILVVMLAPVIQKTVVKTFNKINFRIRENQFHRYKRNIDKIEKICYRVLNKLEADRVVFMVTHNGDITYTNMNLAKLTCLCEAKNDGIESSKDKIFNKLITNFNDYVTFFINHKIMRCNDIDHFIDDDTKYEFINRGIKSFFVVMVTRKEVPLGFLRVEFCFKKNHTPEEILKIEEMLNLESKKIYSILKP